MEEGSWYRVDVPETELSVLSVDTLYYNYDSHTEPGKMGTK